METLLTIIISIGVIIILIRSLIINNKKYKSLKDTIKEFESKPPIKKYPLYVKLDSNLNPRVYKIKDIMILPQNDIHVPELCLVITGKDKDGNTYNATIDKFVTATEEEYNKNKKDELEF